MRGEYWYYAFWLLVIGSWVLGVAYGRWGGGGSGIFADLGQAVSVPSPANLSWWQPILYFTLTVVPSFVLSQIFFGAGAAVFIFSRGVNDALLFNNIELMVGRWNLTSIPSGELWSVFFIILILTVNLPLCLWASHLGTQSRDYHTLPFFYNPRFVSQIDLFVRETETDKIQAPSRGGLTASC